MKTALTCLLCLSLSGCFFIWIPLRAPTAPAPVPGEPEQTTFKK